MEITLTIPDELAASVTGESDNPAQVALEALALEGFRQRRLSAFEVRQLLGHGSRWETEEFLAAHDSWPSLTKEDLDEELKDLRRSRQR